MPSGNSLHTTFPPNMVDPLLRVFLDPKKNKEIESWLKDNRIVDSLDGQHYNGIMNKGLESRQKPSNPSKSSKFVGRVRGLKVFVANFTYEYDEKIIFKMPHKIEAFNRIDFKDINTDSIPPFVLGSNDDRGKTYYSDSLTLGPEYKEDESISKEIRHLMKLERETKRHKGKVT
nr:hypothetical protein [Tanacetum cinerariifolium]